MAYLHHKYYPLSPVVPAGTAVAAALSFPFPLETGHLHGMQVQIPAGHNGLTGVRILYLGQQVIPWSNYAWLVGSGDNFTFAWDAEVMATGLTVQAYNTDLTAHQLFLRADLTPDYPGPPSPYTAGLTAAPPSAATLAAVSTLAG